MKRIRTAARRRSLWLAGRRSVSAGRRWRRLAEMRRTSAEIRARDRPGATGRPHRSGLHAQGRRRRRRRDRSSSATPRSKAGSIATSSSCSATRGSRAPPSSTASLVVVGGSASRSRTARRSDADLVVVGGAFDAPAGFTPGGQHIVIGATVLGGRLEALVPWITRGLLWGRPIVPGLPWVWGIVGAVLPRLPGPEPDLPRPVRACAETLAGETADHLRRRPAGAAAHGPGVPAAGGLGRRDRRRAVRALRACSSARIVGKIGVARWIGMSVVRQESPESRLQSVRSFVDRLRRDLPRPT